MTIPPIGSLWYTNVDVPTAVYQHAEPVSPYVLRGDIFTVLETPHVPGTPRYIQVLSKDGIVWLYSIWFNPHTRCLTHMNPIGREAE